MPEEPKNLLRYRILRYTPNLIRDEWVNIGVLLEETQGPRRAVRVVPLLRALPSEFDSRLRAPADQVSVYLEKLDQTLSDVLQLSPQRGLLADDFDAELDRLYREYVSPPPSPRGVVRNMRAWIRERLNDVFLRRGLRGKIESRVRVEEFTQPGDPFRFDYAYRYNGTRGYVHTVALDRDAAQAKVLAYTAECIRARAANSVFTAVTEVAPAPENPRHQFVSRLFEEQKISLVPLTRVERWAEDLRPRLQ